jgi:hypothetical protein
MIQMSPCSVIAISTPYSSKVALGFGGLIRGCASRNSSVILSRITGSCSYSPSQAFISNTRSLVICASGARKEGH